MENKFRINCNLSRNDMSARHIGIQFLWDADADVWVATSDDVPGLVLECGSFGALLERVRQAVPELVQLNEPRQC